MWFDELNKKMMEGENRDYTHPEKAWDEMEALLDKHLPQEKKRRRFIFLLFPILLGLGIATYFVISRKAQPDIIPTTLNTDTKSSSPSPHSTKDASIIPTPPGTSKKVDKVDLPDHLIKQYQSELKSITESSPVAQNKNVKKPVKPRSDNSYLSVTLPTVSSDPINSQVPVHSPEQKRIPTPDPSSITSDLTQKINNDNSDNTTKIVAENVSDLNINEQPESVDSALIPGKITPLKKSGSSFGERFNINFSAGPDISAVSVDRPGRMQLQYGFGLAYALNKNLVIRTGFYAGDKKYNADSASYKMPYPINNLEKVEADCFVYEIPLSLVYHFNRVKKHNWFLAGTVSSYIMKRETYGYYYSNTWGQSQYYDRTYKNENTHLFSVIGVSGGYQYHLSKQLTLLAEPYIKLPIRGIGVGMVKLNNAGVLFTVGYKPFSRK